MERLLLFAPWTADDAALLNSRWMAEQTARLCDSSTALLDGDRAVREGLEAALDERDTVGVALFGHGGRHAVMGADGREAFDAGNAERLGARWAHLVACNTGHELVPSCASHPGFFVGYDVPLVAEWTIEELPEDLQEHLARLVTATTFALLAGERAKPALQRSASEAADALLDWLNDSAPDSYMGLCVLAQQLVERMVVSR